MTRRCDDCLRPLPHTPPEVTACPQTRRWELPLPFDAPPLKDNDRHHWAVKARHTRTLRDASHVIAAHNRLPKNLARVTITLHWRPSINRRRDQLSIAPTLKPLVDGKPGDRIVKGDGWFQNPDRTSNAANQLRRFTVLPSGSSGSAE